MPDSRSLITRMHREGQFGIWEVARLERSVSASGAAFQRARLAPGVFPERRMDCRRRVDSKEIVGIHDRLARDGSQVRELAPLGGPALLWSATSGRFTASRKKTERRFCVRWTSRRVA